MTSSCNIIMAMTSLLCWLYAILRFYSMMIISHCTGTVTIIAVTIPSRWRTVEMVNSALCFLYCFACRYITSCRRSMDLDSFLTYCINVKSVSDCIHEQCIIERKELQIVMEKTYDRNGYHSNELVDRIWHFVVVTDILRTTPNY